MPPPSPSNRGAIPWSTSSATTPVRPTSNASGWRSSDRPRCGCCGASPTGSTANPKASPSICRRPLAPSAWACAVDEARRSSGRSTGPADSAPPGSSPKTRSPYGASSRRSRSAKSVGYRLRCNASTFVGSSSSRPGRRSSRCASGRISSRSRCSRSARTARPPNASCITGGFIPPSPTRPCIGPSSSTADSRLDDPPPVPNDAA